MFKLRLGVSSYSFWHFRGEKTPIETVIREARRMGLDGVEVLHRQIVLRRPLQEARQEFGGYLPEGSSLRSAGGTST